MSNPEYPSQAVGLLVPVPEVKRDNALKSSCVGLRDEPDYPILELLSKGHTLDQISPRPSFSKRGKSSL
jgi:hypothetical protein